MTAFRADLAALETLVARLRGFDARAGQLGADLDTAARRLDGHTNYETAAASNTRRWA